MGLVSAIVGAVVAVAGAAVSYASSKDAAKAQEQQARMQAEQAERQAKDQKARHKAELQREQERIRYEADLAKELFEFEMAQQEENVEYATEQTRKQEKALVSAQQVWASSFGTTGSALNVMNVTGMRADEDVAEFNRQLKQFEEKRRLEVEKVKEGGEFGFSQFKEARTEETDYVVRNLAFEASLFRKKADAVQSASKYNKYGAALQVAGAAASAYGSFAKSGALTTKKTITVSNVARGSEPYGSFTTTRTGYAD